ncbi:MAG: hypothetical protein OEY01_03795 [Desulfobulbaceae bacterium]|nr:hypothetical protein [Desulfobulbaceae bacterium]
MDIREDGRVVIFTESRVKGFHLPKKAELGMLFHKSIKPFTHTVKKQIVVGSTICRLGFPKDICQDIPTLSKDLDGIRWLEREVNDTKQHFFFFVIQTYGALSDKGSELLKGCGAFALNSHGSVLCLYSGV